MLLLLSNVLASGNKLGWIIFGFFSIGFLFMMTMIISKRLIPALKGNIALELDDEGINDYIRDASINWEDIKEISLARGGSSATMYIDLKWESEYGSRIAIPLRWVKGKDEDIYNATLAYFEQAAAGGAN